MASRLRRSAARARLRAAAHRRHAAARAARHALPHRTQPLLHLRSPLRPLVRRRRRRLRLPLRRQRRRERRRPRRAEPRPPRGAPPRKAALLGLRHAGAVPVARAPHRLRRRHQEHRQYLGHDLAGAPLRARRIVAADGALDRGSRHRRRARPRRRRRLQLLGPPAPRPVAPRRLQLRRPLRPQGRDGPLRPARRRPGRAPVDGRARRRRP